MILVLYIIGYPVAVYLLATFIKTAYHPLTREVKLDIISRVGGALMLAFAWPAIIIILAITIPIHFLINKQKLDVNV